MTPPNFTQLFHDISLATREVTEAVSQAAVDTVREEPLTSALALGSLFIPTLQPVFALNLAERGMEALARRWGGSLSFNPLAGLSPTEESLLYLPPWNHSGENQPEASQNLWGSISLREVFGPMISRPLVRGLGEYFRNHQGSEPIEKHAATSKPNQAVNAEVHAPVNGVHGSNIPWCR